MKNTKKKKKDFTDAFKWANAELKTGRDIMSIVFSWGGTHENEIIEYFKAACEARETKIVCAMRKNSKTIQEYEKTI